MNNSPEPLPTVEHLGLLAATLAARDQAAKAEDVCRRALSLHRAAGRLLAQEREEAERRASREKAAQANRIQIPKAHGFPMSWERFIRTVLPHKKGQTADQASIFKAYLTSRLQTDAMNKADTTIPASHHPNGTPDEFLPVSHLNPERYLPTQDEVDRAFAEARQWQLTEQHYSYLANSFLHWYRDHRQRTLSEVRSAAGKAAKGVAKKRRIRSATP